MRIKQQHFLHWTHPEKRSKINALHPKEELPIMNKPWIESFEVTRAMSFKPQTDHLLTVLQGRAWVTLRGEMAQDNPDHILEEGATLCVPAGQHVVIESWARHALDPLEVQWQIAYDALVVSTPDQGIACPPPPRLLPAKAT
jgi:mannose-6-phosphate isomerase-like protein (cupin superfamily)